MGKYALRKYLSKLNAFLVKAVQIPQKALEHYLVLKMRQKRAQGTGIDLIADNDAGRTPSLKILIKIFICFSAGISW